MRTSVKIAGARILYRALSAGRSCVGADPNACTVQRRGVRYQLDLSQGIDLGLYLGTFEREVLRALRRLIAPGMTVLDIGANIGAHTLPAAHLVGPRGRVIAIEPTAFAIAKLRQNVAVNPDIADRISAVQCALGRVDADTCTTGAIYSSWPLAKDTDVHPLHRGEPMTTAGATTKRLDSLRTDLNIGHVHLVKMDVDGFECDVMAGATHMIRRSRPVFVMEFAPYALIERGASLAELISYFVPGYSFFHLLGNKPLPGNAQSIAENIGEGASINVLAIPN
jgi:FkbM family methyltransferase